MSFFVVVKRDDVGISPTGFYSTAVGVVGMGIAHPQKRTTNGCPYGHAVSWIGVVGADIIRP